MRKIVKKLLKASLAFAMSAGTIVVESGLTNVVAEENSDDENHSYKANDAVEFADAVQQMGTDNSTTLIIQGDDSVDEVLENTKCTAVEYDGVYVVNFENKESKETTAETLENLENVTVSEENVVFSIDGDSRFSNLIVAEGEKTIKVALIDTGVSEELADKHIDVTGSETPFDENGHGTKMAQAILENGGGKAFVVSIKAFDKSGKSSVAYMYAAVKCAIEEGANIINISASAIDNGNASAFIEAVKEAVNMGITVVVSAGNNNADAVQYIPANIGGVITIGAIAEDGTKVENSNFGEAVNYYVVAENTSEAAATFSGILVSSELNGAIDDERIVSEFIATENSEEENETEGSEEFEVNIGWTTETDGNNGDSIADGGMINEDLVLTGGQLIQIKDNGTSLPISKGTTFIEDVPTNHTYEFYYTKIGRDYSSGTGVDIDAKIEISDIELKKPDGEQVQSMSIMVMEDFTLGWAVYANEDDADSSLALKYTVKFFKNSSDTEPSTTEYNLPQTFVSFVGEGISNWVTPRNGFVDTTAHIIEDSAITLEPEFTEYNPSTGLFGDLDFESGKKPFEGNYYQSPGEPHADQNGSNYAGGNEEGEILYARRHLYNSYSPVFMVTNNDWNCTLTKEDVAKSGVGFMISGNQYSVEVGSMHSYLLVQQNSNHTLYPRFKFVTEVVKSEADSQLGGTITVGPNDVSKMGVFGNPAYDNIVAESSLDNYPIRYSAKTGYHLADVNINGISIDISDFNIKEGQFTIPDDEFYTISTYTDYLIKIRFEPDSNVTITKQVLNSSGTSIDGKNVAVGDTLTYSVSVKNVDDFAKTISFSDAIPTYTEYVSSSATQGGVLEDGAVKWKNISFDANETKTFTFKVNVLSSATGRTVTNKVTIGETSSNIVANPVPAILPDTFTKSVMSASGLDIVGKDVSVGDTLTYVVTIKNNSLETRNYKITDTLPSNTEYVVNSVDSGGTYYNGVVTWNSITVESGKTRSVAFKVRVQPTAEGKTIVNKAYVNDVATNEVRNNVPITTYWIKTKVNHGKITVSDGKLGPDDYVSKDWTTAYPGVKKGDSKTISYQAQPGYEIKSVKVDNKEVDVKTYPSSYTFNNIDANHYIEVEYQPLTVTILVKKVDTNNQMVGGAVMSLCDTYGNELIRWTSSATEGIRIAGVTPGTYVLREITAPNGYIWAADKTIEVRYTAATTIQEFSFVNAAANPSPNTDAGFRSICAGGVLLVAVMLLAFMEKKK